MGGSDWMKPKPTDGPVSRYLNRRVSTAITRALLATGRPPDPDVVTLFTTAVAFLAAYLVIAVGGVLAGVAIQLASIIDGVDGEIARALGRSSRAGAFLDSMMDRFADIAMISAVGARILSLGCRPDAALYVLAAALSGDLMVSYLHARGEMLAGKHPSLIGYVRQMASRDVRLLILALGIAAEPWYTLAPVAGLVLIASLAYAYVAAKVAEVYAHLKRAEASSQRA